MKRMVSLAGLGFSLVTFVIALWEKKMRTDQGHALGAPGSLLAAIKEGRGSSISADSFLASRRLRPAILAPNVEPAGVAASNLHKKPYRPMTTIEVGNTMAQRTPQV